MLLNNVPKVNLATQSPISFTVTTRDSGIADLEVFVLSPNAQNVPVNIINKSEESKIIEFIPNSPGHYKMNIFYGGEPLTTSPLTFAVSASGKSDARAMGNGLEVSHRGKETSFIVYCPIAPNVQIEQYNGHGERIEPKVKALGNNEWKIIYTIMSVGKYVVRASCPNRGPLPGSPWTVTCVDSTKVLPIGGWSSLLDSEGRLILPARFTFETTDAGPGELLCFVDHNDVKVEKLSEERFKIFIPAEGN